MFYLLACSEFALVPADKSPGGDDTAAPSGPPIDVVDDEGCEDTGTPPTEPAWSVGVAEPDPDSVATCTALGEVDWTLATRWRTTHPGWVMNVVVAPTGGAAWSTVWVDDAAGNQLVELDGRDGSVVRETPLGAALDDGSTPAVGDMDGDGAVEFVRTAWGELQVVDGATRAVTSFPTTTRVDDDEAVSLADVDLDGDFDLVLTGASLERDGTRITAITPSLVSTGQFVMDLDGDGAPEAVNGAGVWSPRDGSGTAWTATGGTTWFFGAPFDAGGTAGVLYTNGRSDLYIGQPDGTSASLFPSVARGLVALADATGDGVPDLCLPYTDGEDFLILVDVNGVLHQGWAHGVGGLVAGGCSFADLDADGVYEVIHLALDGLRILDGVTGAELAYDPSLSTLVRDSAPVIADLDGDGSAEILVLTDTDIVAVGPATGRWARTRPVWNQLAYDVTSIRDDGSLVAAPVPVWSTYDVFRAQPSHDGAHPDLAIEASVTVAPWCDTRSATFDIEVSNPGSVASADGAVLRLLQADGTLSERDRVTLPAIPAGERVRVTLELEVTTWGGSWVLDVVPMHDDECDWVNNRVEGGW